MADAVKLSYKDGGGNFKPHGEGTHAMIVVDAIDMGYRVKDYPGTEPEVQPFVALVWASGERQENGELITVSRYYRTSMHKKAALRQALEAMRGKSYTEAEAREKSRDPKLLAKLAGFPCLVTVEHKASDDGDRTWARVTNLSPVPKGMTAPTCADYERGAYWEERKAQYAEQVARFGGKPAATEPPPDATQADDEDGDLPF